MKIVLPIIVFFYCCLTAYATGRITSDNLTYIGMFKLPEVAAGTGEYKWEYGGHCLAFNPNGDPEGPADGYTGSLYSAGEESGGNSVRDVAEFTIPIPKTSSYNTATMLQGFYDITEGKYDSNMSGYQTKRMSGLAYMPIQGEQASPKIYWTYFAEYDVEDEYYATTGYSDLTSTSINSQGSWKIGSYFPKAVSGYLFDVPTAWADTYLGGRYLVTGNKKESSDNNWGPSLVAIEPYDYTNASPPSSSTLPEKTLIWYDETHDEFPSFSPASEWKAGSWLTAGNSAAVIIVGKRCTGTVCYGSAQTCPNDCSSSDGYHCSPNDTIPQMVFYDVDQIASVAAGTIDPWDIVPYEYLDLTTKVANFGICTRVYGMAYDRANSILYMIQYQGDPDENGRPTVHAFSISGSVSVTHTNSVKSGVTTSFSSGLTTTITGGQ